MTLGQRSTPEVVQMRRALRRIDKLASDREKFEKKRRTRLIRTRQASSNDRRREI